MNESLEIQKYESQNASEWDAFVEGSKNGTFLLRRTYMDYHSDRFADCSLLFYIKHKLCAVLPANRVGDTLYSHQGLTYGGLIMDRKCTVNDILTIFRGLCEWLRNNGISTLIYKPVPRVYHRYPSDEDIYAVFNVCEGRLVGRMLSSTIIIDDRLPLRQNRRTALNKAHSEGITVAESQDLATYWTILEDNLRHTHNAKPVHTLKEIEGLIANNPGSIRLLMGYKNGRALGGILLYLTPTAVHTQYISATPEGKTLGVVDAIVEYILLHFDQKYLEFGTSKGDNGELLNEGLMFQKEGFGARGICYDTYEITL